MSSRSDFLVSYGPPHEISKHLDRVRDVPHYLTNPYATGEHHARLKEIQTDIHNTIMNVRKTARDASISEGDAHNLDAAVNSKYHTVRQAVLRHHHLTPEHLHKLIDQYGSSSYGYDLAEHPNLKEDHLDKLLKSGLSSIQSLALSHPSITKGNLQRVIDDPHSNQLTKRSVRQKLESMNND